MFRGFLFIFRSSMIFSTCHCVGHSIFLFLCPLRGFDDVFLCMVGLVKVLQGLLSVEKRLIFPNILLSFCFPEVVICLVVLLNLCVDLLLALSALVVTHSTGPPEHSILRDAPLCSLWGGDPPRHTPSRICGQFLSHRHGMLHSPYLHYLIHAPLVAPPHP